MNFSNYSIGINLALFAVAAGVVWFSGSRISGYADQIARKTGIGHVAIGLVLLGGITSLPEVAVALFSAITDNPVLAVNNLLGGIAMQKAILAGTDAMLGKEALTVIVSSPSLLLQAALGIVLLLIVAITVTLEDVPVLGIGIGSWLLLIMYLWSVWILSISEGRLPWVTKIPDGSTLQQHVDGDDKKSGKRTANDSSLKRTAMKTALAALAIMAAGFLLSQTASAIAEQTGLGQSFVGAVLLAFSTSLPELSTVIAAMRLKQYEMAISDIMGTNMFNLALIFLVDSVFRGEPVLNQVGSFSLFAALLGIALTTIYLIGLIERHNRKIARMGLDSLAILIVYAGGLLILYQLR